MDFFQATQKKISNLNQGERRLYEYVIKNMNDVKNMSIQKFAEEMYLSTTTIFRFTQKLGFTGYTEFTNSLLVTSHQNKDLDVPEVVYSKEYNQEYLKNIIETARVLPNHDVARVIDMINKMDNMFILADENSAAAGLYAERLFVGLGSAAYYLTAPYDLQTFPDRVGDNDIIIALSYSGEDITLLDAVKRAIMKKKPFLLSITRAENNPLESISDVNFYIFADEINLNGIDLTTSVPAIMLLELLAYEKVKLLRKK